MNYVILNADHVVVGRSKVASAFSEEDGLTILETEEWPGPGMVMVNGAFVPPVIPLDLQKASKRAAAMAERDRRIDGGFTFDGVRYQSRPEDRENIAGAAQLASDAILIDGVALDDKRWHGGETDFVWIAEDNSEVAMDVATVRAFAKTAAAMKSGCIFRAKALKEAIDAAPDETALDAIDITAGWPV